MPEQTTQEKWYSLWCKGGCKNLKTLTEAEREDALKEETRKLFFDLYTKWSYGKRHAPWTRLVRSKLKAHWRSAAHPIINQTHTADPRIAELKAARAQLLQKMKRERNRTAAESVMSYWKM